MLALSSYTSRKSRDHNRWASAWDYRSGASLYKPGVSPRIEIKISNKQAIVRGLKRARQYDPISHDWVFGELEFPMKVFCSLPISREVLLETNVVWSRNAGSKG